MLFFLEKNLKIFGKPFLHPLELLAMLVVCGRFYYLMGFVGHLKPTAPMPFLFIKDVLIVLVICSFFLLPKAHAPKGLKTLLAVWLTAFGAIACVHFFAKSFSDWGQHYVRNVLLVLATAPALYRWAANPKIFNLNRFLFWACAANILAAILQELFIPETMLGQSRPLGFVGDPISLTAIILIFVAVILTQPMATFRLIIYSVISGYALNMAASISACLSAAIAAVPTILFLWKYLEKSEFKKLLLKITISLFFILSGFMIPHQQQYDNLTERIKVLYNNHLLEKREPQSKADDLLYDSLKNGRAQSLEITKQSISSEKIESNLLAFWIGEYKNSLYRRVDSTPAVLIINWGFGLCLLLYSTYFFILITITKNIFFTKKNPTLDKERLNSHAITIYVITTLLTLGFLNSILYRSPLNFIFVLVTVKIFYLEINKYQTNNFENK